MTRPKTAQNSVKQGMRINMTLCFSQQQAAAVYAATKGTKEPAYCNGWHASSLAPGPYQ
jgi:transaldolase